MDSEEEKASRGTNPAIILLGAIAVVLVVLIGVLSFLVLSSKEDSENTVADVSPDEKDETEQVNSEKDKDSSTDSADSVAASTDPLSVIIWDSNQRAGIQEICDDWTALGNPKVMVEATGWGDYWERLEAGAARRYHGQHSGTF